MNELQVFSNPEFGEIRTVVVDGEPWFVGKDVATALGYADTNQATRKHVDNDDKLTRQFNGSGQKRDMIIINESGLYSLILGSKLESAKKFKHWVTSEVLPSIRRNGGYIAGQETLSDEELLAKALLVATNKIRERDAMIEKQTERIEEMRPKEIFADAVASSDSLILMRDLAKILKQNGVNTGQNRLWNWMRENGYICKNSTAPTQRAMERGLFAVVENAITRAPGQTMVKSTTKVTTKGQQYFINKFLGKGATDNDD